VDWCSAVKKDQKAKTNAKSQKPQKAAKIFHCSWHAPCLNKQTKKNKKICQSINTFLGNYLL
jgi:hypothetical protein